MSSEVFDRTSVTSCSHCNELEALVANIPGGICQCLDDPWFTIVAMSDSFLSLFGYTREEIRARFGERFVDIILPGDRETVMCSLREQLTRGDEAELEYRVRRGDGRVLWVLEKGRMVVLPDGGRALCCVMLDITTQREEKAALSLALERHQIILDQSDDIIFEWDMLKDTLIFSPNWRKKFGYEPITEDVCRNIPDSGDIFVDDVPDLLKLLESLRGGKSYAEGEARIRNAAGGYIWCRIRATTQFDGVGRPVQAVGVILDVDEERKRRQTLQEQAEMDPLTGLLNKRAAQSRVEELLGAKNGSGVLFIIDIDDFKLINDRYGHLCGDAVLSDMAGTLKRLFRSSDVKARIGGDEFMVFMPGISVKQAAKKAADMVEAVSDLSVYGHEGHVSCSIGAAACPNDASDFYGLYQSADMALYSVKNSGKGSFAFHGGTGQTRRSSVGGAIESDGRASKGSLGEYCFRMLYSAMDPVTAMAQLLEIVGQAYDVSRVYIFESSEDGLSCSNTFEWCGVGVPSELANLQALSYTDDLADYSSNFQEKGVFYCEDTAVLLPALRAVLDPLGVRSLLQCAIMDDGKFKGFVGFDECRENRVWTREQIDTLVLVCNVVSIFLLKLRLKEHLAGLEKLSAGSAT